MDPKHRDKRTGKKKEATEMIALSRVAGTSRLERIRNEMNKEEMGVQKTIIDLSLIHI